MLHGFYAAWKFIVEFLNSLGFVRNGPKKRSQGNANTSHNFCVLKPAADFTCYAQLINFLEKINTQKTQYFNRYCFSCLFYIVHN